MAKKNGFTAAQVIDALEKGEGYVSKTASLLGCSPRTVYNYRDRFPTVAEAWAGIRERRHDFVENKLHMLIKDGNVAATIFYLKTQAKDRGYVERQELTGAEGRAISVSWDDVRDND
jgi:hypothetical protein